jgi:hypothetical protein
MFGDFFLPLPSSCPFFIVDVFVVIFSSNQPLNLNLLGIGIPLYMCIYTLYYKLIPPSLNLLPPHPFLHPRVSNCCPQIRPPVDKHKNTITHTTSAGGPRNCAVLC